MKIDAFEYKNCRVLCLEWTLYGRALIRESESLSLITISAASFCFSVVGCKRSTDSDIVLNRETHSSHFTALHMNGDRSPLSQAKTISCAMCVRSSVCSIAPMPLKTVASSLQLSSSRKKQSMQCSHMMLTHASTSARRGRP